MRLLKEAKSVGTLYHITNIEGMDIILNDNILRARTQSGLSFTRDKNLNRIIGSAPRSWFKIVIDGDLVDNNANITELVSFSSHASRESLTEYYTERLRFNKLLLVHGEYENKVTFAQELQDKLASQGKSSRVVAVNADSKVQI